MLLHLLRMLSSLAHYLANLNYRQPSWLARSREGIRTRDACPRHIGPGDAHRAALGRAMRARGTSDRETRTRIENTLLPAG